MKVIILAGGLGSRISEYTHKIPKPMIKIGKKPIIWHIMKSYEKYGYNDFIVALGYKGKTIKNYLTNLSERWNVKTVDTGLKTMTGGRLKRLKNLLGDDTFMLTYGDGLANININKLVKFHKRNKKLVTVTAVRPPARFGYLKFRGEKIIGFKEKSQLDEGWINGGFFVMESNFLKFIKNDETFLEKSPLEKVANQGQLNAFKHRGFWQCMDTKRDKDYLEKLSKKKQLPWK